MNTPKNPTLNEQKQPLIKQSLKDAKTTAEKNNTRLYIV